MFKQRVRSTIHGFGAVLIIAGMAVALAQPIMASAVPLNVTRAPKVSFTFDDGLASSINLAAPTLQKYGFTATNYVISGCMDMTTVPNNCAADTDVPYMSWTQVKQLHDNYGWEIGSHTATHPLLASTSEDQEVALTTAQVTKELTDSRNAIMTKTGLTPTAFASPYGDYNPTGTPVLSEIAKLYTSHRGFADTGYNITPYSGEALAADNYPLNNYLIRNQQVQTGVSVADVKSYVDKAITDNAWLVLTFHEIKSSNASSDPEDYQYNNGDLDLIAQYIQSKNLPAVNISAGLPSGVNNLVGNGDFNAPLVTANGIPNKNDWTTDAPDTIKNDSTNNGSTPGGSTNSIKISATAIDTHLFSPIVVIDPTKNYILKIYVNLKTINTGDRNEIAFYIDEYDIAGNYISTQYKKSIMAENPLVKDYVFQYTPTTNTGQARLQLNITANSGITGYVDSVEWYATDGSIPVPPDAVAPVVSTVTVTPTLATEATVAWTTDEAATTQVEYGTTTAYGLTTTEDATLVTAHSVALTGLTANTAYNYRVISKDAFGNMTTSENFTFTTPDVIVIPPDVTAPVLSLVVGAGTTTTTGLIGWVTDEAATTQVEYGTTTAYGTTTIVDPTLITVHSVSLADLTTNTTYHYRVISTDAAGNTVLSEDLTFTTPNIVVIPPVDPGSSDINNDGLVDELDLSTLLSHWGPVPGTAVIASDVNKDGVVDELDLSTLLAHWSK